VLVDGSEQQALGGTEGGTGYFVLVVDFAGGSGQQRELVLISQPMQRLGGLQEGPT
jgi:hypothetical protein